MARRQGGTLGTFTPLSTPNAPTGLSVSTSIGSASVSFTAPTDTGDGAITSYIVTAINESTGASTGATGSASPITISTGGGTFKIRAQAVNDFGPGRLTEFSTGNAVYSGAELWSWGENTQGQLGLGNRTNRSSPVQVGVLTDWLTISANKDSGNYTSASVKTDGSLWTWGGNNDGVLGLGTSTVNPRSVPAQVGTLTNWSDVSISRHMLAVKTDGTLWAWGVNNQGPLGQNNTISRSSPVQVGALTDWEKVATPFFASLAIKTDGTLWSWGFNVHGALGVGDTVTRSSPVQVGALTNWSSVSGGGYAAVATKTEGTLFSWGRNNYGQLGDGTVISRSSPVQVGSLTTWAKADVGVFAGMAVKTDGTLWAWGFGVSGTLGTNNTISRSSPVQVGALTTWSSVSTNLHTLALRTDGTLWAWGDGGDGRLGDGTVVNKSSPVQIGSGTTWYSVAAGRNHSLATTVVL